MGAAHSARRRTRGVVWVTAHLSDRLHLEELAPLPHQRSDGVDDLEEASLEGHADEM